MYCDYRLKRHTRFSDCSDRSDQQLTGRIQWMDDMCCSSNDSKEMKDSVYETDVPDDLTVFLSARWPIRINECAAQAPPDFLQSSGYCGRQKRKGHRH